MSTELCENDSSKPSMCLVCGISEARYTCPKCNIVYCSLACYQSASHSGCSEAFYHDQVVSDLSSDSGQNCSESHKRMQEILLKFHKQGLCDQENLDSDDSEGDENVDDIITRLAGVDLDDADAVWQRLSMTERADFENLLKTGGITELLPSFTPWWERTSRVVQEINNPNKSSSSFEVDPVEQLCTSDITHSRRNELPSVITDVPVFQDICKRPPSHFLQFNAVNIVSAYVFIVRCFNGAHMDWPSHAAYVAWGLSGTLNNNDNYSTVQDAIASAATCASQKEKASEDDLSVLKADTHCIVSCPLFLSAAISDCLSLFRAALRHRPPTARGPFSQRFCDGADSQLPRDKLKLAIKKLEFMLSWTLQN